MGIVYLQVADELDGDGRHPVRLGWTPGAAAPELEPHGSVPATPPAGKEDGDALYALLADEGRGEALDRAGAVVLDVRPKALAELSWERVTRPLTSEHRQYAFLDPDRPWSRGRWEVIENVAVTLGPLRVLVVVCDTIDPTLRADDEIDGVHRAAKDWPGRIHLEVLDAPAKWSVLRAEIDERAPHVVHLIGHTRQLRADAVIEFAYRDEDGARRTWELRSGTLRQSWPRGPRLVVLSACRTQQEPAGGVPSLTAALRAQVPAVLGMAGDISSPAAVEFARGFYVELAAGRGVDTATAAGRQRIFDADPDEPDWSYPVLESRSGAGLAMPVRLGVDEQEELTIRRIGEFAKLDQFVDRSVQRRRAWWAIDAEGLPAAPAERKAVLITGPARHGKTWLAQWSMRTYALRGRRRQYVDLTGTSPDWLAVVRAVRDGMPGCELSGPMPAAAFGSFTARLNWLLRRPPTVDMPGPDAAAEDDEGTGFDLAPGQTDLRIATVFDDLCAALRRSAEERPLVLAIDGTHVIDDQSWENYVRPGLIRPLVAGVTGVRLLLVMPDHLAARRLGELLPRMERIDLGGFPRAELPRIVREYGVRSNWPEGMTREAASFAHRVASPSVSPEALAQLAVTMRLLLAGGAS